MRDGIELRALQPGDLPAYKALRDAMLAAHPHAFASDSEAERARTAHSYLPRLGLDRPDGAQFTLGAFLDGELVGAVTCHRDARIKLRHIGHVSALMVRNDLQGQGIGRALMEACLQRARTAGGLERLTLSVTAGNAVALRLYESLGFRHHGRLMRALKRVSGYHDKDHLALDL